MKQVLLLIFLTCASFVPHVCGQSVTDQKSNEAEIAAYKRRVEILRHPSGIITIRLAALGRESSTAPSSDNVDKLRFQMFLSVASVGELAYSYDRNRCYAYRPELIRDGDILPYSKQAKECVERAEREPGGDGFGRAPEKLTSGREYLTHEVNLRDWYETPLRVGHYQLVIRKQFYPGGDWIESNPITFDVGGLDAPQRLWELLKHPTFISVRLASISKDGSIEKPSTTPSSYIIGEPLHFQSFITQSSNEHLLIVGDRSPYYAFRPQLIRDGDFVPYSKHARERIENAERGPNGFSAAPAKLESGREYRSNDVRLEDWYELPMKPGRYQLTMKRRFTLDGDWIESNPVTFDVVVPK